MNNSNYIIRNAFPSEFEGIGKLLIRVYSQLEGFPKESEQPNYYKMLANIGDFTNHQETELLVAVDKNNTILGAVVFLITCNIMVQAELQLRKKTRPDFDYWVLIIMREEKELVNF